MEKPRKSTRENLIQEGLSELNHYGISDFSVRRIATSCGVSCATPYKHFKDKNEFIAAIIEYARSQWTERQQRAISEHAGSKRNQIMSTCREYINFLVENPYFRSILMSKDRSFDAEHIKLKSRLSETSYQLVDAYCDEVKMPSNVRQIKSFVVRSILYGAAMMIDNGEIPNTPEVMDEIIGVIDREFNLPWDM